MMKLLDWLPVKSLRRSHGLEHATIHILSQRFPDRPLAGRAARDGFFVYGDVPTEAVESAVKEALYRLKAGERYLAIHPRCGTNFVVTGILAGLSSFAVGNQRTSLLDRVSRMILASTLAILLAQPLGPWVQERLTTSWRQDRVQFRGVKAQKLGKVTVHHVLLDGLSD